MYNCIMYLKNGNLIKSHLVFKALFIILLTHKYISFEQLPTYPHFKKTKLGSLEFNAYALNSTQ